MPTPVERRTVASIDGPSLTAADPSSAPAPRAGGLTTAHLFMMSFGAIVGVGWITILGQWLSLAGPGGSVIALVLGAASVLLIASNYGLLSRTQRLAAGEIGAVTDSLGAVAGFAVTAALAMASISVVAFEAVSAGWIVVTLFPALEGSVLYTILGRDVHAGTLVIALVGTTVVGIMNLRPLPKTARTQNAVVLLKLAVTAVFCIAGLTSGKAQHSERLGDRRHPCADRHDAAVVRRLPHHRHHERRAGGECALVRCESRDVRVHCRSVRLLYMYRPRRVVGRAVAIAHIRTPARGGGVS
jgi:hypothetical protein